MFSISNPDFDNTSEKKHPFHPLARMFSLDQIQLITLRKNSYRVTHKEKPRLSRTMFRNYSVLQILQFLVTVLAVAGVNASPQSCTMFSGSCYLCWRSLHWSGETIAYSIDNKEICLVLSWRISHDCFFLIHQYWSEGTEHGALLSDTRIGMSGVSAITHKEDKVWGILCGS